MLYSLHLRFQRSDHQNNTVDRFSFASISFSTVLSRHAKAFSLLKLLSAPLAHEVSRLFNTSRKLAGIKQKKVAVETIRHYNELAVFIPPKGTYQLYFSSLVKPGISKPVCRS